MNPKQYFELFTALAYKADSKKTWIENKVLPVVIERIEADLPSINALQSIISDNSKIQRDRMVGNSI